MNACMYVRIQVTWLLSNCVATPLVNNSTLCSRRKRKGCCYFFHYYSCLETILEPRIRTGLQQCPLLVYMTTTAAGDTLFLSLLWGVFCHFRGARGGALLDCTNQLVASHHCC